MILRFQSDRVLKQKSSHCQSVSTSAKFPTMKYPMWEPEVSRPPENTRPQDASLPIHSAQLSTLRIQSLEAEKLKEGSKD